MLICRLKEFCNFSVSHHCCSCTDPSDSWSGVSLAKRKEREPTDIDALEQYTSEASSYRVFDRHTRSEKPYMLERERVYCHYFLHMDNYPVGWPLLYETPLGMCCLYGKVMSSKISYLITWPPYWIWPDFRNDALGFGSAQGRRNRVLLSSERNIGRQVRTEHFRGLERPLEILFRSPSWNIGGPVTILATLVSVDCNIRKLRVILSFTFYYAKTVQKI